MSTPNDETTRNFRVVSDEFINAESDDIDVNFYFEDGLDNEIEKGGEGDSTGDKNRDDNSEDVHDLVQKKLKKLKRLRDNVDWETEERIEFFHQLDSLVQDWISQPPDLNNIFQQEKIDFLLIKAVISDTYSGQEFIEFVVRTGYKDRFEVPEDDKYKPSVLHRTTAIHHAARNKPNDWELMVNDLFKIYDRFDVNYVDELGLTHFHVACMTRNCQDLVPKFLERGQVDPNLIWPETGDSPLHLSVGHECEDSAEILMRNGADPNSVNKDGLTPLHLSTRQSCFVLIELIFEICEDMKQPLQVNARDNLGNTPLHLALSCGFLNSFMVLLTNGADPNLANKDGLTPLHLICKKRFNFYNDTVDTFFEISDEMNQLVQVDARDKLGRTPLQWAVANIKPYTVESLLNHGADLSSFVLLPENEFTSRFDPNEDDSTYFKLRIASGALAILESLEKRGYQVEDYVLIIIKIFSRLRLFKKSTYIQTRWYDDEKFASQAKKKKILPWISRDITVNYHHDFLELERAKIETAMTPSLSLYDLIRLRPEEATKILTYRDYYDLDRSKDLRRLMLPENYLEDVMVHLYEKVPRVFCRRWGLEYFFELIHYRLPILCCEKIIDQLMNVDLCNICFAATGQDPF